MFFHTPVHSKMYYYIFNLYFVGTVIRTSLAKLLEHEKEYMCNKCRHVFTVHADFSQHFTLCGPTTCPSEEGCNSYKFTCNGQKSTDSSNFKDYQEIKIQEQAQKLSVGTIPRAISVVLEDDLVDLCKPGDDVTVYGVVLRRWKPTFNDVSIMIYIFETDVIKHVYSISALLLSF